jgi:hypothetical protein
LGIKVQRASLWCLHGDSSTTDLLGICRELVFFFFQPIGKCFPFSSGEEKNQYLIKEKKQSTQPESETSGDKLANSLEMTAHILKSTLGTLGSPGIDIPKNQLFNWLPPLLLSACPKFRAKARAV